MVDLEELRAHAKCGLFSSRDNTNDALDYALQLADAEQMPNNIMCIAIMVYHNTLVDALINAIQEKIKEEQNAIH